MFMPMFAQTNYSLPTTTVDYIPYSTYANLFANDIPITIDGVPYYVNVTAHTDSAGNCISSCYVTHRLRGLDTQSHELANSAYRFVFVDNPSASELAFQCAIRRDREDCDSVGHTTVNKVGSF